MAAPLADTSEALADLSNLDAIEDTKPHTFRTVGNVLGGMFLKSAERGLPAAPARHQAKSEE